MRTFIFLVCFTLAGGTAGADLMVVKFRSGKVQTLRLDEPSSEVVSIGYQDSVSAFAPQDGPAKTPAGDTADKAEREREKGPGTSRAEGRPPVRMEWASPME